MNNFRQVAADRDEALAGDLSETPAIENASGGEGGEEVVAEAGE
jgi:hypothetical protein